MTNSDTVYINEITHNLTDDFARARSQGYEEAMRRLLMAIIVMMELSSADTFSLDFLAKKFNELIPIVFEKNNK